MDNRQTTKKSSSSSPPRVSNSNNQDKTPIRTQLTDISTESGATPNVIGNPGKESLLQSSSNSSPPQRQNTASRSPLRNSSNNQGNPKPPKEPTEIPIKLPDNRKSKQVTSSPIGSSPQRQNTASSSIRSPSRTSPITQPKTLPQQQTTASSSIEQGENLKSKQVTVSSIKSSSKQLSDATPTRQYQQPDNSSSNLSPNSTPNVFAQPKQTPTPRAEAPKSKTLKNNPDAARKSKDPKNGTRKSIPNIKPAQQAQNAEPSSEWDVTPRKNTNADSSPASGTASPSAVGFDLVQTPSSPVKAEPSARPAQPGSPLPTDKLTGESKFCLIPKSTFIHNVYGKVDEKLYTFDVQYDDGIKKCMILGIIPSHKDQQFFVLRQSKTTPSIKFQSVQLDQQLDYVLPNGKIIKQDNDTFSINDEFFDNFKDADVELARIESDKDFEQITKNTFNGLGVNYQDICFVSVEKKTFPAKNSYSSFRIVKVI